MEHLEQTGGQSLTAMTRLCSLVFVTLAVDGFMVTYCLENISVDHATALVLFAFGERVVPVCCCLRHAFWIVHDCPPAKTNSYFLFFVGGCVRCDVITAVQRLPVLESGLEVFTCFIL